MSEITVSEQHKQAVELHQKIIVSANLAQQNIWDMCTGLKQMRDDKLYKELGYANFGDYCENEVGMKRSNAYNYISIVEKINQENVQSIGQIGMTKLSLLATISEQEQSEIAEKIDLENTTVKQLKAEIEKLKSENHEKKSKLSTSEWQRLDAENRLKGVREHNSLLEQQLRAARGKTKELTERVEELESRPIEVAVAEPSDNERRLQETIKSLERENIRHYDELEAQYREDEKAVREMLEKEKQEALAKLTAEYEDKLKAVQTSSETDDKDVFKAYFSVAYDSFCRMLEFAKQSADKEFFKGKIKNLINSLATQNINL